MVLVLALGVLGSADALTTPTITSTPAEFSTVNTGSTIRVTVSTGFNDPGTAEALQITVTNGTFPDPSDPTTMIASGTSETWAETGMATNVFNQPLSTLVITTGIGPVSVTVDHGTGTSPDGSDFTSTGTQTRRFYAVDPVEVATAISLDDGGADGFQIRSTGARAIGFTATSGSANPIPVTFNSSSGNLFVQRTDAGSTRRGTRGRVLTTSSAIAVSAPPSPLSDATPYVMLDLNATSTVTMSHPSLTSERVVYIYGRPKIVITGGNNQEGIANGLLEQKLSVKVTDGQSRPVTGVPVEFSIDAASSTITDIAFIPVDGTIVYVTTATGILAPALVAGVGTIKATSTHPNATALPTNTDVIFVQTNSNGVAEVSLQLGPADTNPATDDVTFVNADLGGGATPVSLLSPFRQEIQGRARIPTIEILSGNNQRADANGDIEDPLVVVVKNRGQRMSSIPVTFTTTKGLFQTWTDTNGDGVIDPGEIMATQTLSVTTNASGEAEADFFLGDASGVAEVTATITGAIPTVYTRDVTFNINGTGSSGGGGGEPPPVVQAARLTISATGEGTTRSVTVNAFNAANAPVPGLAVTLSGTVLTSPQQVITGTPTTITLPTAPNTYTLSATAVVAGYTPASTAFTITAPGTLFLEEVGARSAGGAQQIRVTVREANGTLASGSIRVTLSGAVSRIIDTTNGTGGGVITLPATGGPHTVTLRAEGYTTQSFTLSATGQQPTTGGQPTITNPGGVAESLEIDGSRQLSSTVNQSTRLRVRVLDANDSGVRDVRVTFRVLSPGKGRLSQRGNGRAVVVETDRNGYATANLTPLGGDLIVEAKAAGVRAPVSFIISAGEAADTETDTGTGDTTQPPSREIDPQVHVGASSRPPMLWVDGGAIYALVGAEVERFAPSVDNALNLAVGGGKVYWTEKTGDSSGTVNSANLDGSGVKEVAATRFSVPLGIAVDTANKHLYWTNSSGKIKRANLDGRQGQNVLQNLSDPMDIALSGGNVYWTQGNGSVRFTNLRGTKNVRNIATGTDTPMSIAVGGGKVYWTEKTGDSSGTVNSANLNGSGAKQLAESRWSVPIGIAVDTARSRLYWTNSSGKIKRANLDGRRGQNVVDGLGSPGELVLSNSIAAPTAAKPMTPTPTPTDSSAFDVNGDGTVDNTDAALVADAVGTNDPKSDVNGDGTVNFLDLLLVFDNRDDGAAAAPTIVGMQMTAAQVDILQEQIDLLIATGDRSPAAIKTLIYLQQLIATARPEQTQLLANYPNPFNPETWIPYELATDTNVKITIYNTQGVVIRTLELGQQSAGYYTGRDRAAYWDGRNALGEQVASGIYFYQFETDDMSTMRKMVILK